MQQIITIVVKNVHPLLAIKFFGVRLSVSAMPEPVFPAEFEEKRNEIFGSGFRDSVEEQDIVEQP
jgi:hypothetical protein